VPAIPILDLTKAFAFQRPGNNESRLRILLLGLSICRLDLVQIMAVDLDWMPAESAGTSGIDSAIPAHHRLAALAKPVHIEYSDKIGKAIVSA
jgi:hypothetical protein